MTNLLNKQPVWRLFETHSAHGFTVCWNGDVSAVCILFIATGSVLQPAFNSSGSWYRVQLPPPFTNQASYIGGLMLLSQTQKCKVGVNNIVIESNGYDFTKLTLLITTHFHPRTILAIGYCCCLRMCVCVCLFVCQSRACPCDNSSPIQGRITKFGPRVKNTFGKIPIILGSDWPWPLMWNLMLQSKFHWAQFVYRGK